MVSPAVFGHRCHRYRWRCRTLLYHTIPPPVSAVLQVFRRYSNKIHRSCVELTPGHLAMCFSSLATSSPFFLLLFEVVFTLSISDLTLTHLYSRAIQIQTMKQPMQPYLLPLVPCRQQHWLLRPCHQHATSLLFIIWEAELTRSNCKYLVLTPFFLFIITPQ